MRKQYLKSSLKVKISLTFIIIIFAVMGIFVFMLYQYFYNIIQNHTRKTVNMTAISNAEMLEQLLQRLEVSCDLVHDGKVVYTRDEINETLITKMIVDYVYRKDYESISTFAQDYNLCLTLFHDYFVACFGGSTEYSSVLFVDSSWPVHHVMPRRTLEEQNIGFSQDSFVKEEEWYQNALAADGAVYWFVDQKSEQLCMAKKMKYQHLTSNMVVAEETLGVILVQFSISSITENMDLSSLTQNSSMFVLDQEYKILHSNRPSNDDLNIAEMMDGLNKDVSETIDYKGSEYMISVKELPMELCMLTLVPNEDIYQIVFQAIRLILVLGIVMICVALFMTYFLSWTIFEPLQAFADYMEAGGVDMWEFDYTRRDELGKLYRSYSCLIEKLDESMEKERDMLEKKREVELRSLQLQINPHFMYNTLNSVSCLAMMHGQELIAELIDNLTQIMRYNVSNPHKLVRIEEEIYMIRQYETIQKKCYEDKSVIEYNIEEAVKDLLIPKLIIQPLIENAMFYGVDQQKKTVQIKLSIFIENDNLVITVWDSGKDADIERINQYIMGEKEYRVSSFGIRNIAERIGIVYGEGSKLAYESDGGGYTTAVIYIPIKLVARDVKGLS